MNVRDFYNNNSRYVVHEDYYHVPLSDHESKSNRIIKARVASLDELLGTK